MLVDLTLKDQLKKFLQSERKPEKKKILGSIREERNNNNKKIQYCTIIQETIPLFINFLNHKG